MFGWDDAIIIGIMLGEFVYHRWINPPDQPPAPQASRVLALPRVATATPHPILYGRQRVNTASLMWASRGKVVAGSAAGDASVPFAYGIDQLLVLGIPWPSGANTVRQIWAGNALLAQGPPGLSGQTRHGGTGGTDTCVIGNAAGLGGSTGPIYGIAEVLDGRSSQQLVDAGGTALTFAGQRMKQDGVATATITGFRNFLSVFLCSPDFTNASGYRFWIGSSQQVPGFGFEFQSLPAGPVFGPNQQVASLDGDITSQQGDMNPIDVIYDLIFNQITKLGLFTGWLDVPSWAAAAATLDAEGNGFSRCFDDGGPGGRSVADWIGEILQQIDGVLYEDPTTGLLKIKLVRDDYDITTAPSISADNGAQLSGFATGGWTDVTNKVVVEFDNRADDYRTGSGSAANQANAVGQDGQVRVVKLRMPGVCTQALADQIATRELAARCRPMMKCRAVVNRSFFTVCPGDVVSVSWPEYGLSHTAFRVAAVDRGSLEDGKIQLDLIQDYYHVWRLRPPGLTVSPPIVGGAKTLAKFA